MRSPVQGFISNPTRRPKSQAPRAIYSQLVNDKSELVIVDKRLAVELHHPSRSISNNLSSCGVKRREMWTCVRVQLTPMR
jgi:hypothetical protein